MIFYRFFLVIFLSMAFQVHAADMGFRYKDGKCKNAKGEEGYNTLYFGQCTDFSGVKLNLFEFENIDFSGSRFENADLSACKFKNVNFTGASLKVANLSGSEFDDVNFLDANLENARLTNATLFFVSFSATNLDGVIADKINGQDLDFSFSNLSGAQFNGANLQRSRFVEVVAQNLSARGANFKGTDLREAKLKDCDFSGALFEKAKASDVRFHKSNLKKADFSNANLYKARFLASDIRKTNFMTADVKDVVWTDSIFSKKTQFKYSEAEAVAMGMIYKVGDLFANMTGFDVYRLKVPGIMSDTNVRNYCEDEGLRVPCVNAPGGAWSDDRCLDVGWRDGNRPMEAVSNVVCGNGNVNSCDKLEQTFVYMGSKWNSEDDTCGKVGGNWCAAGTRYTDMYTLCVEPE